MVKEDSYISTSNTPSFQTDDFILKITVPKVTEKVTVSNKKVTVNGGKVSEKVTVNENGYKTPTGKQWQTIQVQRLIALY